MNLQRWTSLLAVLGCLAMGGITLTNCDGKRESTADSNPLLPGRLGERSGQDGSSINLEADRASQPQADEAMQANCPIFPADSAWNTDISEYPVHPQSAVFIQSMGTQTGIHADFASGLHEGAPIGIPYRIVPGDQPKVPVRFTEWPEESDAGPYPIPQDAPIEGTAPGKKPRGEGDHHVIAVDLDNCLLYEIFKASPVDGGWQGYNGAVFDMRSSRVPARIGDAASKMGWTSADAAGLPIFPGLVRYDEVKKGEIKHALRFTASRTQKAFVFPASHWASKHTNPKLPPMGLRLRLKSNVEISHFSRDNQVILRALQKYGMILADNGSNWYISGAPHPEWDNDDLGKLKQMIKGGYFEVVDTGPIRTAY